MPASNELEVALQGSEPVAEGTRAFRFARPSGFAFKAGQAVQLTLENGEQRLFSLASAPFEDHLLIATRMRPDSAFKSALAALPAGAKVRLQGPTGDFTLHEDASRPALFIAGGIGITPFRSMLRQAAHERSPRRLVLVYSNRRPELAAFLSELQGNAAFRLHALMTDSEGMLDAARLQRFAADLAKPVYYVVGPPGMVFGMQETLGAAGVPDDDIRSEEFYGY
jgi:ferredoxin-NADP reductase